jgi:uncharacterized protein (TIGR03663 family)
VSKNQNGFFWVKFLCVLVLALVLRIYQLEARPLHSDEGVNFHFLEEIKRTGVYPYSHENYHGPAYFWTSYWATRLVGMSVPGLRAAAIVTGILLLLTLLPLRGLAGDSFVLIAALLVAVSPSMIFYSRYGIHETLFLLGSTWFAVSLYTLLVQKQAGLIYAAFLALALMVATKETFVITLACLVLAALTLRGYRSHIAFVRENKQHFLNGSLLFVVITCFIYSSGFRSFRGIREIFLSVPQWVGRGTKSDPGHFKRFGYYLIDVISVTEPCITLVFITAGVLLLFFIIFKPKKTISVVLGERWQLALYLLVWTLSIFLIYSAVPYKTPWLLINLTLPALLFTAWCVAAMIQSAGPWLRPIGQAVLCFLVLIAAKNTILFNYADGTIPFTSLRVVNGALPYGPGNPFSYVHTSPGMLELVRDIEQYWRRNPKAKVLVGTDGYWPLPFYLRAKPSQAGYFVPKDIASHSDEYQIIAVDQAKPWENSPWPKKYYRLSDATEAFVYYKPEP